MDDEHNKYGEDFVAPDEQTELRAREAMTQPAYTMKPAEREIVKNAIVTLCRDKGWHLLAVHLRSNHVHVVVAVDRDPERVMSDLKASASRQLTRAGFDDSTRKRWSRHGSTLHLFDESTVADKVDYTLNRQGTPMARYDGSAGIGDL